MAASIKDTSIKDKSARFGLCLKQLRLKHGHTQTQLATLLGISFQQVGKYERGIDWMSVARIEAVCRLYKVGLDTFFKDINATKTTTAEAGGSDLNQLLSAFKNLSKARQKSFIRTATNLMADAKS